MIDNSNIIICAGTCVRYTCVCIRSSTVPTGTSKCLCSQRTYAGTCVMYLCVYCTYRYKYLCSQCTCAGTYMTIVQCTCAGTCVSTVPTGTSICIHNALVQVPLLCTCAGTWLYTVSICNASRYMCV